MDPEMPSPANKQNMTRHGTLTTILMTSIAPAIALAAPTPPPDPQRPPEISTRIREDLSLYRRFEAAGLPVSNPPANGGQCIVDTRGSFAPPARQRGASESYRLYEIHRWEVDAAPSNPGQYPLKYAVRWTSTGNGERIADNGVGTRNVWTFTISGQAASQLTALRIASSGNWLVQMAPASLNGGGVIVQQPSVAGMPQQQAVTSRAPAAAVSYPSMVVAGTPPGAMARVAETRSFKVPAEMNWGYPRPAYATGNIHCTWTIGVGP